MSSILTVFYGKVHNGKFRFQNASDFHRFLTAHEGKELAVTFRRPDMIRTSAENRYYWGVIVRMVSEEMGVLDDEAHEYLKSLFLKQGVEVDGKRFEIARSTASLSVGEFEEYAEKCRQCAASELSCVIPLPGEIIFDP